MKSRSFFMQIALDDCISVIVRPRTDRPANGVQVHYLPVAVVVKSHPAASNRVGVTIAQQRIKRQTAFDSGLAVHEHLHGLFEKGGKHASSCGRFRVFVLV